MKLRLLSNILTICLVFVPHQSSSMKRTTSQSRFTSPPPATATPFNNPQCDNNLAALRESLDGLRNKFITEADIRAEISQFRRKLCTIPLSPEELAHYLSEILTIENQITPQPNLARPRTSNFNPFQDDSVLPPANSTDDLFFPHSGSDDEEFANDLPNATKCEMRIEAIRRIVNKSQSTFDLVNTEHNQQLKHLHLNQVQTKAERALELIRETINDCTSDEQKTTLEALKIDAERLTHQAKRKRQEALTAEICKKIDELLKESESPMTSNRRTQIINKIKDLIATLDDDKQKERYADRVQQSETNSPVIQAPQIEIQHRSRLDLPLLTQTFFAYKEYEGNFTERLGEQPDGDECSVTIEAFKSLLQEYKNKFDAIMLTKEPDAWFNNPIDFSTNSKSITERQQFINTKSGGSNFGPTIRYVQQMHVAPESTVCVMGDYHGSVHALIRNLWRLVKLGKLNPNLTINDPNFFLVFQGDYIDRGSRGLEVITTLLILKLINWDQITLLAGNHETALMACNHGFATELSEKYGVDVVKRDQKTPGTPSLMEIIYSNFFDILPVALFMHCGDNVIQYCHGGIEPNFNPKYFLASGKMLYNAGNESECHGLFWTDFCSANIKSCASDRGPQILKVGLQGITSYLTENPQLKAISRAHQDNEGVMFISNAPKVPNTASPTRWNEVARDDYPNKADSIFLIEAMKYPVFTFSSAVEGRKMPYENFGIIRLFPNFAEWNLEVHEYFLKQPRHNKFVCITALPNQAEPTSERITPKARPQDLIGISWDPIFNPATLTRGIQTFMNPSRSHTAEE